jgi:hypothetical protein
MAGLAILGAIGIGALGHTGDVVNEGHQLTKEHTMNAATQKAARKEANKALTQQLRDLVAAGKADQALALVEGRNASWAQIVTDAVARKEAKAAKAAEEPKAPKGKAPKAKADKCGNGPVCVDPLCAGFEMVMDPTVPAVSADVAALMQQVQALQDALTALTAPQAAPTKAKRRKAAETALAAVPTITAAEAAAGVSGEFFTITHETALKGLAFLTYGKAGKVAKSGDASAIVAARTEARQCAAWCAVAAEQAETIEERARLMKKAAIYREAVLRLS